MESRQGRCAPLRKKSLVKRLLSGLITAFAETVSTLTAPPPANGGPTAFQTALTAFLDRAAQNLVPLALSFVAGQFGLGNLPQMLQKALSFIPNTVVRSRP